MAHNESLTNLRTLVISNEELNKKTAKRLLEALVCGNFINLEKIQKLNSNEELSEINRDLFQILLNGKTNSQFNFESIKSLFPKNFVDQT